MPMTLSYFLQTPNLDFVQYINLIFYVVLGLAILFGFLRGMKKSLFNLIVMTIFYIAFFLTVGPVSKVLWTAEMPWLGQYLEGFVSLPSGFTSFANDFPAILTDLTNNAIDFTNASQEMLDLINGLGQFVIKIVYTVLYFTVILILWKFICWILAAIFVRTRKGESKNRGFGALFGAASGLLSIFIILVTMGGMMSVLGSIATVMTPEEPAEDTTLAYPDRQSLYEASSPIMALEDTASSSQLSDMVVIIQETVDAYNSNIFVKIADKITTSSVSNPEEKVPLHLDLFDRVLSFEYEGETVAFRYELSVLSDVAGVFLNSDFATTNNIADITGDEIATVFDDLGKSNLITTIMPLAIETAADYFDVDLPITRTELYDIDFAEELPAVGGVAASLFDILNGADMITGEGDVGDITVTPQEIRDLFQDISDSQVIMLAIETVLVPMLEDPESDISMIVSIPDGIIWEDEVIAIGNIMADIFTADLSFADITGGDTTALLNAAASIEVDDILDSKLVTYTLINILSGDAGLEAADFLEIPDGIVWIDEDDDNHGELENILIALHSLISAMTDIDFENIGLETIYDLTDTQIDDVFGSYVITATISKIITDMDFGDNPIIIPNNSTVIDSQGYIKSEELKTMIKSVRLIVSTTGEDTEFSLESALSLSETDIATLLDSKIIAATVGNLVADMEVPMLEIPDEVTENISALDHSTQVTVISKTELQSLLNAMTLLDLTDFDSISFTSGLLDNFESETVPGTLDQSLMDTFFDSKIILASATNMIQDLDDTDSSILAIPVKDSDGNDLVTTTLGTDYFSTTEMKALFNALFVLSLDSFTSLDMENMTTISDNIDIFLESSILHSTISNFILNNTGTVLVVPDDYYGTANPIVISYGSDVYIDSVELSHLVAALSLNSTAFGNISDSWSFDIGSFLAITDLDTLIASEIMQATISANILPYVKTMAESPTVTDFVVPAALRQSITVDSVNAYQIEANELKHLLNSMKMLGLSTFDSTTDPDAIMTIFNDPALANEFMLSGSMHITLDNMIKSNSSVSSSIPDKAYRTSDIYGLSDIILKTEIIAFINAASTLAEASGSGDFTNITFNFSVMLTLNQTQRQTIVTSMIVRNVLTPDAVTAANLAIPALDPPISASDYEDGDIGTFLTYDGIVRIMNHLLGE